MDIEIRPITLDEWEPFIAAASLGFNHPLRPGDAEATRIEFEEGRCLAAFDEAAMVGTAGALSFRMTTPGGASVPTAGVTTVAVVPTHRRRGVLTALMRRQLDDVRAGDEPLAALWASEGGIYGRFGYGIATRASRFEINTAHTQFLHEVADEGRVRLVDLDGAVESFPAVYDATRTVVPGMLERTPPWWRYRFEHEDDEQHRGGFGPMFYAVHESPDGNDAYAAYRVKHEWPGGVPAGTLEVVELAASTPAANAAIWRYLFDMDLVGRIEAWGRPEDEPLFHVLAEPRRLGLALGEGLWVRLVDVPGALTARRYAVRGRLVLEVRDSFCPWNEGRFLLEGGPDGATCERTDREPDVVLGVEDLGAAYLGGTSVLTLAAAGRVTQVTSGAATSATRLFAWHPSPWCPHQF